ncbi:hypothetical protein DPM19_25715 [Actinomadura craniellae]|uniref:DUF4386 domain-containing protein n=1 Tax=Actinomadura craniellae TaxID=2231787 RepID=A0A365H0D4_9ACTN|nr:hypothetical protein [Actinomadura craniellae]RAY12527.1 hypothetical protein DPM19_25715 [Actinomadura craniellae]
MTSATSTLTGSDPADGERPERGGSRDVRLVYWLFAAFYTAMSVGVCLLGRATPPPRPDVTDLQVALWFDKHQLGIQVGFVFLLVIAGGAAVSNGIIGYFMKRMSSGKVLAYAYIAAMGVGAIPGFHLLLICWLTATFRPDRDERVLHLLYDLGMLSYNGSLGCFTAAYAVLAIAILYDRNRVFPKWFAYISIWQIVTEVVATQMWLFHSGALAWNGMITFYIAVVIFGLWVVCLLHLMRRAAGAETSRTPALYAREA